MSYDIWETYGITNNYFKEAVRVSYYMKMILNHIILVGVILNQSINSTSI